MKKNILIIGVGGHLNSVIDILQEAKKFKIIGYLDNDKSKIGKYFYNIKVLGSDKKLDEIKKSKTNNIFLSVGLIKNFKERMKLIKKLKIPTFEFPNFYSKDSLISKRTSFLGLSKTIWRHSSDPIEPPAPVTKTTLFLIFTCRRSIFALVGSLPNKSFMLILRKLSTCTLP